MADPQPPLQLAPKRNRWRYAIVAVACVGAVVWMLVLVQHNIVFFKTVSQAVHDEAHDGTKKMRIGGGVVPNSIKQRADGVDFDLYQGGVTVHVHHTGSEPPLFKECAPVVAEGRWEAAGSTTFDSTRLLIKHGSDYEAPRSTATTVCPKDPFGR